jgi:hypothetical protein
VRRCERRPVEKKGSEKNKHERGWQEAASDGVGTGGGQTWRTMTSAEILLRTVTMRSKLSAWSVSLQPAMRMGYPLQHP